MNERQFDIYNRIVGESFGTTITLMEEAGRDRIKIRVGVAEYVIFPDGDVVKTGPRMMCDGCKHSFTPL